MYEKGLDLMNLRFEGRVVRMQTQPHIGKKINNMLTYKAMSNTFYHQLLLEDRNSLCFYVEHGLASSDHDS